MWSRSQSWEHRIEPLDGDSVAEFSIAASTLEPATLSVDIGVAVLALDGVDSAVVGRYDVAVVEVGGVATALDGATIEAAAGEDRYAGFSWSAECFPGEPCGTTLRLEVTDLGTGPPSHDGIVTLDGTLVGLDPVPPGGVELVVEPVD